jgi:hypothetical protein
MKAYPALKEYGVYEVDSCSSHIHYRGVAQLVARTAGGREVAGSSPVTPTK